MASPDAGSTPPSREQHRTDEVRLGPPARQGNPGLKLARRPGLGYGVFGLHSPANSIPSGQKLSLPVNGLTSDARVLNLRVSVRETAPLLFSLRSRKFPQPSGVNQFLQICGHFRSLFPLLVQS